MARRIRRQCPRRCRPNAPAGFRRARRGLGIEPQQEQRHTRRFGREREPARAGEPEQARTAHAFRDHRAERGDTQRIHRRRQQRRLIRCLRDDARRRIDAELREPRPVKRRPARGRICPQPDDRCRCRRRKRHQRREPSGRTAAAVSENLMQPTAHHTRRIEARMSRNDARTPAVRSPTFHLGNDAAQIGEGGRRIGHIVLYLF